MTNTPPEPGPADLADLEGDGPFDTTADTDDTTADTIPHTGTAGGSLNIAQPGAHH